MARKDIASIVSGVGWACDFVGKLVDGLLVKGHTPEEIHSLVTAKSRPAMDKIVEEISNFLCSIGSILLINRTALFNPAKFLGEGWSIWRGPADGDGLSGDEEQDERSLALTEVDFSKVRFETCLKDDEHGITGEEKLRRLKEAGHIRLDAKVFQTLWENKDKIPESWKEKINDNIRYIFFDGTILRSPSGSRDVLCFCWDDGEWHWYCRWFSRDWSAVIPSAVLAKTA
ncbi:MAG: hypothetical protein AAB863_03210 [Patescibacteria group bacterium]